MLTLQQIITDADVLVPNGYDDNIQKVVWLNAVNGEFFDVVKIPKSATFSTVSGTKDYTLTGKIKEKDIDKVMAGHLKYRSLNYEDVQPGQNYFTFDEASNLLTLSSPPSQTSLTGIARYYKSATSIYTVSAIGSTYPDAPEEYHWIYALGLAEYIAKANEEDAKAANYGGQYRAALATAASNYKGGASGG